MSGLGETSSSLRHNKTTEKGSIIDNDGVRATGLGMSGLGVINLSLCCKRRPQCR